MEKKGNIFTQILNEYKKVQWASKKDVFQTTLIVLLITLCISVYVTFFDFIFSRGINGISNIVISLLQK